MDILIPLITGITILAICFAYDRVTSRRAYLNRLRDHAARRALTQAWEAEIEFLRAERPNSLDKIVK